MSILTSPTLTVVLPVYNVEPYLGECLDSVLSQQGVDLEIIAVNDGSTDGSLNILEEYAEKHGNIKIINQENRGLSAARNEGMDAARGKFLLFVDSDDLLVNDSLGPLMEKARAGNYDIIEFDYTCFCDGGSSTEALEQGGARGASMGKTKGSGQGLLVEWVKRRVYCPTAYSRLYSVEFLQKIKLRFAEELRFGEDGDWTVRAFRWAAHVCYLPLLVYLRRLDREGSLVTSGQQVFDVKKNENQLSVSDRLEELGKEDNITPEFSWAMKALSARCFFWVCQAYWDRAEPEQQSLFVSELKMRWVRLKYAGSWKLRWLYYLGHAVGLKGAGVAYRLGWSLLSNFRALKAKLRKSS